MRKLKIGTLRIDIKRANTVFRGFIAETLFESLLKHSTADIIAGTLMWNGIGISKWPHRYRVCRVDRLMWIVHRRAIQSIQSMHEWEEWKEAKSTKVTEVLKEILKEAHSGISSSTRWMSDELLVLAILKPEDLDLLKDIYMRGGGANWPFDFIVIDEKRNKYYLVEVKSVFTSDDRAVSLTKNQRIIAEKAKKLGWNVLVVVFRFLNDWQIKIDTYIL